jgi:hypothetical protein
MLPFAVLYWLVPFWSDLTIGNDYIVYGIQAQIDLNHSLAHDSFPLYGPGFSGGHSTAAMTLAQLYHPISHLARLVPGYWDGQAIEIYTTIKLLSLGIAHIALFFAFRVYGANSALAFLVTGLVIYNMKMLDHFRYGAALEAYTAMIILASCVLVFYARRDKLAPKLGIIVSSYLLVSSGHPQMAYLAFLSIGVLMLFLPSIYALFVEQRNELLIREGSSRLCFAGILIIIGIALALPYISTFVFEFMSLNSARTNNDYAWSLGYGDTWGGVLRNFYMPLQADVGTGFGGSALWLLVFLVPFVRIFGLTPDRIIWCMYALILFILVVCMGDASPLYKLVWGFLPLADNFRLPGRYATLMLLPTAFLLFWLLKSASKSTFKLTSNSRVSALTMLSLLTGCLLALLFFSVNSLLPASSVWHAQNILNLPISVHSDVLFYYLFFVCCLVLVSMIASRFSESRVLTLSLYALACVNLSQTAFVLQQATWITETPASKTLMQLDAEKRQSINLEAIAGYGLTPISVDEQMELSILEPRLALFYRNFTMVLNRTEAKELIRAGRDVDAAIVLSDQPKTYIDSGGDKVDTISLIFSSYNRLDFEVEAQQEGLLVTNIPFRNNWQVFIDGNEEKVLEANGYAVSVLVPKGRHNIELRYRSYALNWSLLISSLILIIVLVSFARNQSTPAKIVLAGVLLFFCSLSVWLFNSLYTGSSFNTHYVWSSDDFPTHGNLAYARQTSAMNLANSQMPFYYYPGKAVDGDREGKGYASAAAPNARSWKVDLGGRETMSTIEIYGIDLYAYPLSLWVSDYPSKNFQLVAKLTQPAKQLSLDVSGLQGRYLALSAKGSGRLHFTEFEVYGEEK